MSDFKQQVEEIVHGCPDGDVPMPCDTDNDYDCNRCVVDRILAAHNAELDRIAESVEIVIGGGTDTWNRAVKECQAYIQAQKGS